MGKWQGIASAFGAYQEREFAAEEKEKERAYERELMLEQRAEKYRDILLPLYVERETSRAKAERELAPYISAFASRFSEEEMRDPRVQKLLSNSYAAVGAEKLLTNMEKEAMDKGVPVPMTRGLGALDLFEVFDTEDGTTQVESTVDLETILTEDYSDWDTYAKTVTSLSGGSSAAPYIRPTSAAGFGYDPKRLEDATQVWDNQSIMIASRKLKELDPTAVGYTELRNIIDGADKGDPVSLGALRTEYGLQALTELEATENPAVSYLKDNPTVMQYTAPPPVTTSTTSAVDFNRFSREQLDQIGQELVAALSDPNSSEQEKVEAEQYLRELQTFLEGSR